jgi:hypothetical protein
MRAATKSIQRDTFKSTTVGEEESYCLIGTSFCLGWWKIPING